MNTKKKPYTTPELTVVTFKAERGYVNSIVYTLTSGIAIAQAFDQTSADRTQEEWQSDNTYSGYNWE